MNNAVIYTRFSPRRNADDCASCETQLALCRRYAASKGYTVTGDFRDEAISGSSIDRPGLWSAVEMLNRGDVLVVYKRDRLARDVYLSECINRAVAKMGAIIEAVDGDVDGQSKEANLVRQIMSAVNEYERLVIAARTRHAMQHHQGNGQRMARYAPYGWRLDPDFVQDPDPKKHIKEMMLPAPEERDVIDWIMKLRIDEKLGNYAIASRLNADERMRPLARNGHWTNKGVRKIIERAKA